MPAVRSTALSFLVLVVNYHSEEASLEMVESVMNQNAINDTAVYVIDNSPSPNSILTSLDEHAQVRVLAPGDNLGYFGGAAYGLDQYLIDAPLPDWVIVSNPDIVIDDPQFFERLKAFHVDTSCAVVAPSIFSNLTGDDQNPFMTGRPSRQMMAFRERIARSFFVFNGYELLSHLKRGMRGLFKKSKTALGRKNTAPRTIYAPHGSFFIFKRDFFEAGGHLNYAPFLYYEENFIAEAARQLNLPVLYDPRLHVTHQEHASTGFFKSRHLVNIIHDARAYFLKEYYTK